MDEDGGSGGAGQSTARATDAGVLLCNDRLARRPHDCRYGTIDLVSNRGTEGTAHAGALHARRGHRLILALRGHCVDLPVATLVPDGHAPYIGFALLTPGLPETI